MQIKLTEHDGVPYYQQVVSQIKLLIATGRMAAGEQLPSVRRLAEQLVINPNTVARAYRELEQEGAVESRRGAGVFVASGGTPLSQREIQRRLQTRIDQLLTEAHQLNVAQDTLIEMVRKRGRQFTQSSS